MKSKKLVIIISMLVTASVFPMVTAENTFNSSGPELETYIISGFSLIVVKIHVKNTGDAVAHNVTLTEINIDGNIILNFQESKLWSVDLEPGGMAILDPNSMTFGFGKFTISMTVVCDEGASSTSSVIGLIFGPLVFIP